MGWQSTAFFFGVWGSALKPKKKPPKKNPSIYEKVKEAVDDGTYRCPSVTVLPSSLAKSDMLEMRWLFPKDGISKNLL